MKLFTVITLIITFLASSSLAIPYNYNSNDYKYCTLKFAKPKEGIIYQINSTQTMQVTNLDDCTDSDYESKITFEIFSIGKKAVIETIAQEEKIPGAAPMHKYLIDKVWANDQAKYFYIATLTRGHDSALVGKSGVFTAVDELPDNYY